VLDPCAAVAAQVLRVCDQQGIPTAESGARKFLSTGNSKRFAEQAEVLLGIKRPEVELVEVGGE